MPGAIASIHDVCRDMPFILAGNFPATQRGSRRIGASVQFNPKMDGNFELEPGG